MNDRLSPSVLPLEAVALQSHVDAAWSERIVPELLAGGANANTLNNSPISCSFTSFCIMAFSRGPASFATSSRPQLKRKRPWLV